MKRFAELLDRLVLTPSRNGKLKLMTDYFRAVPDPERGYALAAITDGLDIRSVKPAMLRALMSSRIDDVLFDYSYDYVGDLAEAIALVWPSPHDGEERGRNDVPTLAEIVETLNRASRLEGPRLVEEWLDRLDSSGRYALLKLVTGSMRIGLSARLAKQALADFGKVDVAEIEELWHGLQAPYLDLFAWLEGEAGKPVSAARSPFRPVMLSQPLEPPDYERITREEYAAEWKWDGIRVQATCEKGTAKLYSRSGDDISSAFPDLLEHMRFEGSLDGELLVARPAADSEPLVDPHGGRVEDDIVVGTFSDLQQRLNRKTVSAAVIRKHPVFLRCYDLLQDGAEDLRPLAFKARRERLDAFATHLDKTRFDVSPFVLFETFEDLTRLRADPPHAVIEGLMLKRWDSAYVPGRPKGPWFKWKQDPHVIDAVLMYAQRGHGKRSSFYSDYTFGVWAGPADDPALVPVGKAYFGFTDEELKQLDKYVRDNTVERFGPVRSVRADPDHGLVLEIAFEGLQRSGRHKSGIAMRFPRVSRLRWDKPAFEADRIETLEAMLPA
ncbi:cisplatin damage response ATP-dependent DNA ligase [Aureimonas leprariae]|uniref:DNA ligase (ATP) n=1 Tax=Plantimonas leprariae TaxID=2615207 RepID=A0A7V7TWZ3_9HYPH|nr:cisplatin damage response ATP-dependent DNA ligase [Aureimonas leprariae]KAB0680189.1 cisplatin damage response ATP-dependent DNA ligase [Aureimonas leprariae]